MAAVLLAHEDAGLRRDLTHAIEKQGVRVLQVVGAREALEAALAGVYDLIVVSPQQSRLDGRPLSEWLQAAASQARVVTVRVPSVADSDRDATLPADDRTVCWSGADSVSALLAHLPAAESKPWGDLTFASLAGFARLQARYRDGLSARLLGLRAAAQAQDWPALRQQAHAIKGSASCYELPALSVAAARLEQDLMDGETARAAVALQQLADLMEAAMSSPSSAPQESCHE